MFILLFSAVNAHGDLFVKQRSCDGSLPPRETAVLAQL